MHSPTFDEAIAAIIDENGGVHLNDGPGSLFALVPDSPSDDKEVNVFIKPINNDFKQNQRRGLSQNHIIVINRTQLAGTQSANNRGIGARLRQPQQQYIAIQHQALTPTNYRNNSNSITNTNPKPSESQRSSARNPRQRIHIIVNNRTQVQEIPIDDQIDFQRIPVIHQSPNANRYSTSRSTVDHNRRPLPALNPQSVRTTTPAPRRESTERSQRIQNSDASYQTVNSNARTLSPEFSLQPEIVSKRKETIPQRPPPVYRTPEPFSVAQACNQKACRLPDCLCSGSDVPGIKNAYNIQLIFLNINYMLY